MSLRVRYDELVERGRIVAANMKTNVVQGEKGTRSATWFWRDFFSPFAFAIKYNYARFRRSIDARLHRLLGITP